MSHYDLRLVAYSPGGARLGELPQPMSIEAGVPLSDASALVFKYSDHAVGAHLLSGPVEIAAMVLNPRTGKWFEPDGMRFMLLRHEGDDTDDSGTKTYTAPGMLWALNKVVIYPLAEDHVLGQVTDATATEASAREKLLDSERRLRSAAKVSDRAAITYSESQPSADNSGDLWIDYEDDSAPKVKVYDKADYKWKTLPLDSVAKASLTAWGDHQVSQSQLRDAEDRSRLRSRVFTGTHPGAIMHKLLEEAGKRGGRLKGMAWDFNDKVDSSGKAWPKWSGSIELNVGESLMKAMQAFVDAGALDMTTGGRVLRAFPQESGMVRRREGSVALRPGVDVVEAPDRSTLEGLASEVMFMGEGGLTFTSNNQEAPTPWGTWEAAVVQSNVRDEGAGRMLSRKALEDSSGTRVERTRELVLQREDGYAAASLPWIDYRLGDYISAPGSNGRMEPQRIHQITLTYDAGDDRVSGNLVLNDRFIERELRNARRTEQILGGSGSAGTGGARADEQYVDLRTPVPPELVKGEGHTYFVPGRGGYDSLIDTSWHWRMMATNGTPMDSTTVDHYQARWRIQQDDAYDLEDNRMQWFYGSEVDGDVRSTVLGPVAARNPFLDQPAIYEIQVRTYGVNGKASGWSRSAFVQMPLDDVAPEPPSVPALSSTSIIRLEWDGLNNVGSAMAPDFQHIEIQEALLPNGLSPEEVLNPEQVEWRTLPERMDSLVRFALLPGRDVSEQYAYRLIAVDWAGNPSEPSGMTGFIQPTQLVDTEAMRAALDAAQKASEAAQRELDSRLIANEKAQADLDSKMVGLETISNDAKAAAEKAAKDIGAAEERLTTAEGTISQHTADLGTFSSSLTSLDRKASDAARDATSASDRAETAAADAAEARTTLETLIKSSSSLLIGGDYEQEAAYQDGRRKSLAGPYSGSYALELPTDKYVYVAHPQVGVNPGMQLRGSFMVKQSAGSVGNAAPDIILRVIKVDGSHEYFYPIEKTAPTLTSQWQEYVFEYAPLPDDARLLEPWIRNGFSTVADGTARIYIDWARLVDVGSYKVAAERAEAAEAAAEAAARTANDALTRANLANQSADGKTTTTYTLNSPKGVGLVEGDTHYRVSSTGSDARILQQWRWSGSGWVEQKVDGSHVVNFDAGYITSGFLDVANRIKAGSIWADKMVIGIGENLIPMVNVSNGTSVDPHIAYGSGSSLRLLRPAGRQDYVLYPESSVTGTSFRSVLHLRSGGIGPTRGYDFPVTPGAQYRFSFKHRLGGSYSEGNPSTRVYVGGRTNDGSQTAVATSAPQQVAWTETLHTFDFKIPADTAEIYILIQIDRPGGIQVIEPDLREMTDGSLIVNGTIEGKHVAAKSVAAEIGDFVKVKANNVEVTGDLAAKVGTFMDAKTRNLIVTGKTNLAGDTWIKSLAAGEIASAKIDTNQLTAGSASLDEAVANKIWSDVVSARKIHASQVLIGSGPNLIPNGYGEMGDDTTWYAFSRNDSPGTNVSIGVRSSYWTTSTGSLSLDGNFPVRGDTDYRFSIYARGQNPGQVVYVKMYSYDVDGNTLPDPAEVHGDYAGSNGYLVVNAEISTSKWDRFVASFRPHPAAASVRLTLFQNHSNGTREPDQWSRWAGAELVPMVDNSLIVNGSILSDSLATNAVTAGKIASNAIQTDHLAAGSVKGEIISADAFKGRSFTGGTFTGALFRTSGNRARVQFDSAGIYATDSNGKRKVEIKSSGKVSITGDLATDFNSLGQVQINANAVTGGGADLGLWFTRPDGKAHTFGTSNKLGPVAGIWVSSNYRWDVSFSSGKYLQLRSEDYAPVYVWNGIRLGSWDGSQQTIYSNNRMLFSTGNEMTLSSSGNMMLAPSNRLMLGAHSSNRGDGGTGVFLGQGNGYGYVASGAAANVRVGDNGNLWKTTSQSASKLNQVREIPDDSFMELPVTSWIDRGSWELLEERLRDERPRAKDDEIEAELALQGVRRRWLGVIADEAAQTSAEPLVERNREGEVINFDYARLAVLMLPYMRELWDDYKKRHGMPVREHRIPEPNGPVRGAAPLDEEGMPATAPASIWSNADAPRPAEGFTGIVPPDRRNTPMIR